MEFVSSLSGAVWIDKPIESSSVGAVATDKPIESSSVGAVATDKPIESSSIGDVSIDKPIKSSTNIQLNMFDMFNDIVNNEGQQKAQVKENGVVNGRKRL